MGSNVGPQIVPSSAVLASSSSWNTRDRRIWRWDHHVRPLLLVGSRHRLGIDHITLFARQGRDNKVHHFVLPQLPKSIIRSSVSSVPSATSPTDIAPAWSMDVNSLAYCKLSLLKLDNGKALIAVPSLTKDELVSRTLLSALVAMSVD